MKEIERKFIVPFEYVDYIKSFNGISIKQAYLLNEKDKSTRIRIKGKKSFLTIKVGGNSLSRDEFEYEIPLQDALSMIEILQLKVLSKTRYEINYENHLWEVDIFEGKLDGLIIAEIELKAENESFKTPPWVDLEVTNDSSYLNAKLIEKL